MTDQTPSNIIPFDGFKTIDGNFTQVPNQVFELMPTLSGSELKCLLYIVRHTLGFRDKVKTITIDEFEHGRKLKTGERMDDGVGMGRETIINALKALAERAIITRDLDARDKARQKITYGLHQSDNQTCENQSDYPTASNGLSDRRNQKSRPRSVKDTLEDKPLKETVARAPSGKRPKKADKPPDPHAAAKAALIDVWSKATHNIDKSVFGNSTIRKQAQSMIDAGVTPTLLEDFLAELMRDDFWRKNPPTFAKTLQKIGAWMVGRQPHIVEDDAAPVHTPSTIAPDTKVTDELTAAEFDALTDAERQAQIDLKLASIVGRIAGTEGGKRGRQADRNQLDELNKSA